MKYEIRSLIKKLFWKNITSYLICFIKNATKRVYIAHLSSNIKLLTFSTLKATKKIFKCKCKHLSSTHIPIYWISRCLIYLLACLYIHERYTNCVSHDLTNNTNIFSTFSIAHSYVALLFPTRFDSLTENQALKSVTTFNIFLTEKNHLYICFYIALLHPLFWTL